MGCGASTVSTVKSNSLASHINGQSSPTEPRPSALAVGFARDQRDRMMAEAQALADAASDQPLAAAFARVAISLDGAARGIRPTPPDQLLGAVRNRCPQFQGREQQDAQELYTMLLTGIAEEAAAAACNSDGTSSTQVERMEAKRLLGLVRSSLAVVRLLGTPSVCKLLLS